MRFRDITLVVASSSASRDFYVGTLGLGEDGDAVVAGTTRLRFEEGQPQSPYHLAFNIPANMIRSALAWARTRLPLLSDEIFDFEFWNAEAIYFEDPDGNVLELIARKNLDNDAAGDFGPELLLEVSEFGLPVADPPALISRLEERLGLEVYSGDRDQFTAVGDEHGLFIVVRPGRTWLPTDRAAGEPAGALELESPRAGELQVGPLWVRGGSVAG